MLISCLNLPISNRFDGRILWRAHRTLGVFAYVVETTLVKGVLAEKVHSRQVQVTPARGAATGLEYGRFAAQFIHFFSFCFGLRGVACYQAAVLESLNLSNARLLFKKSEGTHV